MAASPSSPTSFLPAGLRIASRYVIESVIGEGLSGVVYLARRERENDHVAIKVIHRHLCDDEQIFRRFQREAEILKRLAGPHVVRLHDFLKEDGLLMIVLEYIDGTSLEAVMKTRPPALNQAVEITLQICAALGSAHAAGVVHRDLKPANVLIEKLTGTSGSLRVRVVDFGLAKVVLGTLEPGTALTQRGMIFGTPEYMAPEQARGDEVDHRADLYAAGVMLYEMAVGEVPFHERAPLTTLAAHLTEEPRPPKTSRSGAVIPPLITAVILRALAKNPSDRFPSARALAEALTAAYRDRLVITPRSTPSLIADPDALATFDTEPNLNNAARIAAAPAAVASPPESVGTTLRSGPEGKGGLPEDAAQLLRARPAVDVRIASVTPLSAPPLSAPPGRRFWIMAIMAALICVVIGVWIGTR